MPLTLPIPPIFSWLEALRQLGRNAHDAIQQVEGAAAYRALLLDDHPTVVRITANAEELTAATEEELSDEARLQLAGYIRASLDLDRDLTPFYALLEADKDFNYMPDAFYGLRLMQMPSLLEAIGWCIIGQQINLPFAYTLKNRLVASLGLPAEGFGRGLALFPTAEALAGASMEQLRSLQLSTAKAAALIEVGRRVSEGTLSSEMLLALPDNDARISALTAIRGVGPWTANYVLMRSLGITGTAAWGDAGLRAALHRHGLTDDPKDSRTERIVLARFPGWEAYLCCYLWRSLAV